MILRSYDEFKGCGGIGCAENVQYVLNAFFHFLGVRVLFRWQCAYQRNMWVRLQLRAPVGDALLIAISEAPEIVCGVVVVIVLALTEEV